MKKLKDNPKDTKFNDFLQYIIVWIKKDIIIILICCLALAACAITIVSVNAYQDQINDAWFKQWDMYCSNKIVEPTAANITYKFLGDYDET